MSTSLPGRRSLPSGHSGIVLLALTKALDAATTALGLVLVPRIVESNPFAATLFETVGVLPGLLLGSLAVVGVVVLVTEYGVAKLRRTPDAPDWAPTATRIVGYFPPSLLFGAVAVYNAALLWSAA